MRGLVALVLASLACGPTAAAPRKPQAAPSSAADADTLNSLGKADDLPPLLPLPDRPQPARPAPRLTGTAGRSLDLGEVRITPSGFLGVDLQRSAR